MTASQTVPKQRVGPQCFARSIDKDLIRAGGVKSEIVENVFAVDYERVHSVASNECMTKPEISSERQKMIAH